MGAIEGKAMCCMLEMVEADGHCVVYGRQEMVLRFKEVARDNVLWNRLNTGLNNEM